MKAAKQLIRVFRKGGIRYVRYFKWNGKMFVFDREVRA